MAKVSTLGKYIIILNEFNSRKKISAYDEKLQRELELSPKQIKRLFDDIVSQFNNIQKVVENKQNTYVLIKPIDLFIETFKQTGEIGWFFSMAHEADPEIFYEIEKFTNENKTIYKFQNPPFEDLSTLKRKEIFIKLKNAIEHRKYVKITYKYKNEIEDNLRCLKFVFIDNNWYIAFVNSNNKLKLSRLSFINKVACSTRAESYQPINVKKHLDFLESKLQNSMTLYGVKPQKALLKTTPCVSKYFEKGMKKFLKTQKFVEKLDDGSVIFTLNFTQSIEILPFIKKWLPHIVILEPKELQQELMQQMQKAIIDYAKFSQ